MLGVLPVALIEYLISSGYTTAETKFKKESFSSQVVDIVLTSFVNSFVVASLCEELFKFVLASSVRVDKGKEYPYSVVLYSVAGSLGLATLENMLYLIAVVLSGDLTTAIFTAVMRAVVAVPLHASTGIIIGVDVARKKFEMDERKSIIRILIIPILIHGIYDFFMMFTSSYASLTKHYSIFAYSLLSIVTVIIAIMYAKRRAKGLIISSITSHPLEIVTMNV